MAQGRLFFNFIFFNSLFFISFACNAATTIWQALPFPGNDNWSNSNNWSNGVPGTANPDLAAFFPLFVPSGTAVNLDISVLLNTLTFTGPYTISGAGSMTLGGGTVAPSLTGPINLNVPLQINSNLLSTLPGQITTTVGVSLLSSLNMPSGSLIESATPGAGILLIGGNLTLSGGTVKAGLVDNLNGSTIEIDSGAFGLVNNGTFLCDSSTVSLTGGSLLLGSRSFYENSITFQNNSNLNISGGNFSLTSQKATFSNLVIDQTGGVFSAAIDDSANCSGVFWNLSGGTVNWFGGTWTFDQSSLNINGGTINGENVFLDFNNCFINVS